jgi:hypothetical protein
MQWSKLKKQTEALFAPSMKGRVELRSTSYRKSHDEEGRGYVTIDGEDVWNMDTHSWWAKEHKAVAEISQREGLHPADVQPLAHKQLAEQGEYGQYAFYAALKIFCRSTVEECLASHDVLVRALAMCDRRLGKRRLVSLDVTDDHPMVQRLYGLRLSAEGLERGAE